MRLRPTLVAAALLCIAPAALAQETPPPEKPAAPAGAPASPQGQAAAPAAPRAPRAAARARRKKGRNKNPNAAIATFPGFRMRQGGGGSEVYVELSRKVEITEHKAQGRLTYRMKAVEAPTRTNRLPLLTGFFRTPVSRVQLVEVDAEDMDLVIELRAPTEATHKVVETEGGQVLVVTFPELASIPAGAIEAAAAPPAKTRSTTTTRVGSNTDSPY